MILQRYILHSRSTSPVSRSRRLAPASLPGCCCRAAAVSVRCQARQQKAKKGSKGAPSRSGFGKRKGFGGKPQEDWEAQLLPPYRVYYKQGYKPPRFQGTLKPTVLEGTVYVAYGEVFRLFSKLYRHVQQVQVGRAPCAFDRLVSGLCGQRLPSQSQAGLCSQNGVSHMCLASPAIGQAQQCTAVATTAAHPCQTSLCFV